MKKSELKQLIKEEISKILKENQTPDVTVSDIFDSLDDEPLIKDLKRKKLIKIKRGKPGKMGDWYEGYEDGDIIETGDKEWPYQIQIQDFDSEVIYFLKFKPKE